MTTTTPVTRRGQYDQLDQALTSARFLTNVLIEGDAGSRLEHATLSIIDNDLRLLAGLAAAINATATASESEPVDVWADRADLTVDFCIPCNRQMTMRAERGVPKCTYCGTVAGSAFYVVQGGAS